MGRRRAPRSPASRRGRPRRAIAVGAEAALTPDALADRIEDLRARIAPQLPDIDPGDLLLILQCVATPWGRERRIFMREVRPGVYVP